MSSPLDRWDELADAPESIVRQDIIDWAYANAPALVAVARAAERMDKQIWTPQDCDPDEYHDATMALRAALSRLGKDTAA